MSMASGSSGSINAALVPAQPHENRRNSAVVHQKERVVRSLIHSDFKIFNMAD